MTYALIGVLFSVASAATETPLGVASSSSIDAQRQELYQTRERLEQVERRLAELRASLHRAEDRLEKDEEDLAEIRRLDYQIELAKREKETAIAKIRRAMYNIQEQIDVRKQDLEERLVRIYKYGRLLDLELLLSARKLPDVYKKLFYMRMIAEADRHRAEELMQLQADLKTQQDHFKYASAALRDLQAEYERKQRQLRADRSFRAADIGNLTHETDTKEALAERLAAAAEELENLIRQLEKSQPPSAGPSTIPERLPWPVSGRVKIRFGEQTGAAYSGRRNTGIVIESSDGTPVKAVASGRVSYAEEFMTYGNLVILDHGDASFSVYGGLKDIAVAVEEAINEGDVIGHASSALYFELRKTGGPVDPLPYLLR